MTNQKIMLSIASVLLIIGGSKVRGADSLHQQSILIPLTPQNLEQSVVADSTFEYIYMYITESLQEIDALKGDKQKYADVTYADITDYLQFRTDSALFESLDDVWSKEWNTKYRLHEIKIDSIINYWETQMVDHYKTLNKYAKIELTGYEKMDQNNPEALASVVFTITPLLSIIEDLHFVYYAIPKEDDEGKYGQAPSVDYIISHACHRPGLLYTPIAFRDERIPSDVFWNISKFTKAANIDVVKKNYNMYTNIQKIKIEGEVLELSNFKLPESLTLLELGGKKRINRTKVAEEFMSNMGYISEENYCSEKLSQRLKAKNALVYDFIQERGAIVTHRSLNKEFGYPIYGLTSIGAF